MNLAMEMASNAELPLIGRVALVTGATSGIGLGIAEALADRGATVAIAGFGPEAEIAATVADLSSRSGAEARWIPGDLTRADDAVAMVDVLLESEGRLDILVNNAGIQHVAPVESFPPEKWDAILALNLSAAFHAARRAIPAMKAEGFGRILNIASAHGLVASPFKSAYVAAKHGIVGLTKTLALELAEEPITANAICPGYVLTPLVEKQVAEQAAAHGIPPERVVKEVLLKAQPTKRFVTVEEVGTLAAFLVSDAARSITGAAIPIDGGWTAQ
jgi:3-hydroxybutyrate dehydrogenase